jgi:hypothetical protein
LTGSKCDAKQKATGAQSPIDDSLFILNPVNRHLSVDPSKSRFPAAGRQLLQEPVTSPKCDEALTLVKRRFIEYKTVRNDVNSISDLNLHQCTQHIIIDDTLFHAVENALNGYSGGIIILKRKLEIHPLLESAKKTKVKALVDIYAMRWESDNLDSVGDMIF